MAKLKLKIDLDIDFNVSAAIEVFGFEGVVGIRWKKVAEKSRASLPRVTSLSWRRRTMRN
jgi:hypothetical protein